MTCGCNECPECQEENEGKVSIVGECGGCGEECCEKKECCVPNIVADGDCINVRTDDKGVIHLSTRCNPIIESSDNTVNVTLDDTGDVDVWDLKVEDKDHYVSACDTDENPGTLDEKIVGTNGITITPLCAQGKVQIGFDHSTIHCDDKKVAVSEGCTPDYLGNLIDVQSSRLEKSVNNCRVIIRDKEEAAYYAKLVLADNHVITVPTGVYDQRGWESYLGAFTPVSWKPVRTSGGTVDVRNSLLRGLEFNNGTPQNPGLGWIYITKRGLYQVGFTGSAEFNYGVHAFRVQLYRNPGGTQAYNTIVESRYSGPLGYEPWQAVMQGAGDIKLDSYVTDVSVRSDDTVKQVYKSSYEKRIDYPLIGEKTEVEGQAGIGYSASLGAVMDRVTVTGNTIVELDVGDRLWVGLKVSTAITHSGDILANVPAAFLTGHLALLGADVESGDNGPEAGFSYYANLVHPILS